MANPPRKVLSLRPKEVVVPEEDRVIDVCIYDALLPCRKFEIAYKIATVGTVGPSLEFLLRLVKQVPGIDESKAAEFFGFSLKEMAYVLIEATGPGYITVKEGRLWLSVAGDRLFTDEDQPRIFKVEPRQRAYGFDLLSLSPERPQRISPVQLALPELLLEAVSRGKASVILPDRFRRYFRELADRADMEKIERRDLYSIDAISAGERFSTPVRIRAMVRASTPHLIETVDLSSWRPDHEVADRSAVEHAASAVVDDVRSSASQLQSATAYAALLELAPEFLKEFATRDGLSVERYWRAAVGRAGEARRDRKTIPLAGSPVTSGNIERTSAVLGYGLQFAEQPPKAVVSIAPQVRHWGATTLYGELLRLIREKATSKFEGMEEPISVCLATGKPERYVERTYDAIARSDRPTFPPALELLLVPGVMVAALVHAPIGASAGFPVPLGFLSFDKVIIDRAQRLTGDKLPAFRSDQEDVISRLSAALQLRADTASET